MRLAAAAVANVWQAHGLVTQENIEAARGLIPAKRPPPALAAATAKAKPEAKEAEAKLNEQSFWLQTFLLLVLEAFT